VYLRDSGLSQSQDESGFLHGQFFVVVERQHLALSFRQIRNGSAQQMGHLGAQTEKQGSLFAVVRQIFAQVLFVSVERRFHSQAAQFKAGDFSQ
jgi:hypothetical protein